MDVAASRDGSNVRNENGVNLIARVGVLVCHAPILAGVCHHVKDSYHLISFIIINDYGLFVNSANYLTN